MPEDNTDFTDYSAHWKPFEDLLDMNPDDGAVLPVTGIRIVKAVGEDGSPQVRWDITGAPEPDAVAGLLEHAKFLYLMHDLAHHGEDDIIFEEGPDEQN